MEDRLKRLRAYAETRGVAVQAEYVDIGPAMGERPGCRR